MVDCPAEHYQRLNLARNAGTSRPMEESQAGNYSGDPRAMLDDPPPESADGVELDCATRGRAMMEVVEAKAAGRSSLWPEAERSGKTWEDICRMTESH